ncbi:MAG: carboxylating nicotinate-nucleotide diphosphorylase, partial [Rhodospirillales bacterium]|nr:carboxylating nicotinate-nucleotide diphosphorylase [Rhodospirillales bacterium]
MTLSPEHIEDFVRRALEEDLGAGDLTSESVVPEDARLIATLGAREPLVLAGLQAALAVFRALDPACQVDAAHQDGDRIAQGTVIAQVAGRARGLLTAERTALNILQHLSGIATMTRRYVDEIEGTGAILLDTRKTIPGLRHLQKYATAVGGAQNHRLGLYVGVLIKDNHIAVAGGITAAITAAHTAGLKDIEVECDTLDQMREALSAGAKRLLLDNMGPDMLREAVTIASGQATLEASGGVTLETIRS